jgi:Lon protease-like protein
MKIPLFPLDLVLFPGAPLPLHIFEPRYREMIGELESAGRNRRLNPEPVFGIVRMQQGGLAITGCTARITQVLERFEDGRMNILCEGGRRFEIETLDAGSKSYLQAEVDWLEDSGPAATRVERSLCAASHFEAMELSGLGTGPVAMNLDKDISFVLATALPADPAFKQQLLASVSEAERVELLMRYYDMLLPELRRHAPMLRGPETGRVN